MKGTPLELSAAISQVLGKAIGPETTVASFVFLALLGALLWIMWVVFRK